MEKGRAFETIVGFFVLLVALFFFYFVYNQSSWKRMDGYMLTAKFDRADGLADGVDVKLSGVRIGKILSVRIDPETFLAAVKFSVPDNIKLPKDSSATVQSDGLFGGRYLSITPGGEDADIPHGGEIENTVGPTNLESLIGKFMLSKDSDKPDVGSKDQSDAGSADQRDVGSSDSGRRDVGSSDLKLTKDQRDVGSLDSGRRDVDSTDQRDIVSSDLKLTKDTEASKDTGIPKDSEESDVSKDVKDVEALRDSKDTE